MESESHTAGTSSPLPWLPCTGCPLTIDTVGISLSCLLLPPPWTAGLRGAGSSAERWCATSHGLCLAQQDRQTIGVIDFHLVFCQCLCVRACVLFSNWNVTSSFSEITDFFPYIGVQWKILVNPCPIICLSFCFWITYLYKGQSWRWAFSVFLDNWDGQEVGNLGMSPRYAIS